MKSIYKLSILVFFLFIGSQLAVYSYPTRICASYFGGSADDDILDVAFADDGTLVIIGNTNSTDIVLPQNAKSYIFGIDGAIASTAFVARLSNDGKTLLSYSRFAYGTIKSINLRLAVTNNGIYIVAVAYNTLTSLPGFDGKIDSVGGQKPAIIRIALDGSSILNASYLGGGDSDRDVNDIDVFPNGDLCVNHDNYGSSTDFLSRIKPDLSGYVWHRKFTSWAGSARSNALAVSPQGDLVYVGGYCMGYTGLEPYKDPFLFCFSGDGLTQFWKRGTEVDDYGIFHFPQESIGLNRLISDSQINSLAADSVGNALCTGYSDGGATVFTYDPWYGGYSGTTGISLNASSQDGDSFAGFAGATSAGTLGRIDKTGYWIRSHTVKPANIYNRWYGVCPGYKNSAFFVGRASGVPDVESWEVGGSNGIIMKTSMEKSGTIRQFVSHPAGVDAINKVARDRNTYRYAAVGTATTNQVFTVNGFQSSFGGGTKDGYIVVFDDNDRPANSELNATIADANIKYGTEVDKNFGTSVNLYAKRRDGRTYDTSKSYIKFDLSTINKPIIDARFQIYKSGKYDNGDVVVYALKEGFETWDESSITWNNAPANLKTSPWELDKTKADSLGLWKIIKTNSPAIVTYQGTAFTQYIENCRLTGDKKVTLVLTSNFPLDQSDPALTGASKESTTAPIKPTLSLNTIKPASILTELSIWPNKITLQPNQPRQFYANAYDQFGSVMTANVSFFVNNGGTIDQNGLFSTSLPGIYTVTVQSETYSKSAIVNIEELTESKSINNSKYILNCLYRNQFIYVNATDFMPETIDIFDVNGRKLLSTKCLSISSKIPFQSSTGVYFVKIKVREKVIITKILVFKN